MRKPEVGVACGKKKLKESECFRSRHQDHASRINNSPKYRLVIHCPKSFEEEESKSTDGSLLGREGSKYNKIE
jgi:hypothetical protein